MWETLKTFFVPAIARADNITNPLAGAGITDIWTLVFKILDWAIMLAGLAAAASIIWAGYQMIMGGDDSKKIEAATKRLRWSVTGLIIILVAWFIVRLVSNTISTGKL